MLQFGDLSHVQPKQGCHLAYYLCCLCGMNNVGSVNANLCEDNVIIMHDEIDVEEC